MVKINHKDSRRLKNCYSPWSETLNFRINGPTFYKQVGLHSMQSRHRVAIIVNKGNNEIESAHRIAIMAQYNKKI
jgi:hypothetical protein